MARARAGEKRPISKKGHFGHFGTCVFQMIAHEKKERFGVDGNLRWHDQRRLRLIEVDRG